MNEETGQRGFVITGDSRFLKPYEAAARLKHVAADLRRHTALPGTGAALEQVRAAHQGWLGLSAEPEIAAARAGGPAGARRLVAAGAGSCSTRPAPASTTSNKT